MNFHKNIDVVQINIKAGVSEYFFPQNVDWADKKIDKMIVYGANTESGELSPIDGVTPILDREQLDSVYLDLYAEDNTQIAYSMSAIDVLYTNNHPLEINSKISLQTSKLVFSEEPDDAGCILVYVFWNTNVVETEDAPNKSVTVQFPIKGGEEIKLSDVIDTYIHSQSKKVKGIYLWGGYGYWSLLYLTLRDYNYRTIVKLLPGVFCRPPMGVDSVMVGGTPAEKAQSVQVAPFYLDNTDVDFDNSVIYNASDGHATSQVTITFLY